MNTKRYLYLAILELVLLIIVVPLIVSLVYYSFSDNDPYKIIVDLIDTTVKILFPTVCLIFVYIFLQYNNDFNYTQLKKCCHNL